MKNIVSIYDGHDSNITFFNAKTNQYHIIEVERLLKKRYAGIQYNPIFENLSEIELFLEECQDIATKFWGIENNYECVLINWGWKRSRTVFENVFKSDKYLTFTNHHFNHAYSSFYQSPYKEALILSYDGGGEGEYFNFYMGNSDGIVLLEKIPINMGRGYWSSASLIKEILNNKPSFRYDDNEVGLVDPYEYYDSWLRIKSYAGKLMGLCGYGIINEDLLPHLREFFIKKDGKIKKQISNYKLYKEKEGQNFAATIQKTMEDILFEKLDKYDNNMPLVVTGGCALNVIINEKIKDRYKREVYVPPNPNDGGLSLGHIFSYQKPKEKVNITYNGLPLLDIDQLKDYDIKKVSKKDIAKLLKCGKIIGLVYGDSEVGPRALGNRSIVCDPSIPEMKDILNSKVKHREWYRPFAPFCKKEDAHKYFESRDFENMEYMSFAVKVKVDTLPSITHVDGTARLQTVTEESHSHFYQLLTEFGKISDTNVLLNTSFNSRGKPILSTISDAVQILKETELDCVVINDYLINNIKK